MSQPSTTEPLQSQPTSRPAPAVARPPNSFAKFDDRIASVCDRILPKQPYLVTIPSDVPYRKHSSEANRWFINTPFSRKEEQLQYMSLLTHLADDEVLLKVDGTRIDEDGRLLAPQPSPRSEAPTRPQTPAETAPKKKISLKDYKSKDRSGVNTPEIKPPEDIRKQAIKSHKEEVEAKREEQHTKKVPPPRTERELVPVKPVKSAVKPEVSTALATPTRQDKESQRPAKKRRLSAEEQKPATVPTPKPATKLKPEAGEKRSLPSLLSPDMPTPEQKKQKARNLPILLSPKLPETLEKAAKSTPPRSDEVKAIMSALTSPARPTDKKTNDSTGKDAAGRIRSESQTSRPATPGIKISSPTAKPATALTRPGTPLTNGRVATASPGPKQRHRIVLKFSKKNRKRYEMLVKLLEKQKKSVPAAEKAQPSSSKTLSKPETPKLEKKRAPDLPSEQPTKKLKTAASSSLELPPRTDVPSTPRTEHSEKHKPAFSTPKKDQKSILMSRIPSTDTLDAGTPSQEPHRSSTPVIPTQPSQSKTSPAPTSTPAKNDESWKAMSDRVHTLGRVLKKEGSTLAGGDPTSKENQQGAVLLVEALLCFMLSSAALGQWRSSSDQQWSSILPFLNMVFHKSRPWKHLNGIVIQLGAICRQQLQHEQMRRLSKETLPDDHIGSAPTPGSDGNTKQMDDSTRKQKFIELRDDLVHNTRELKTAWLEGHKLLSIRILEESYPSTWSKRMNDISRRFPDKVNLKELPKEFPLPMDITTNVFEATNFTLAFLWEWAMLEQVIWKSRIDL